MSNPTMPSRSEVLEMHRLKSLYGSGAGNSRFITQPGDIKCSFCGEVIVKSVYIVDRKGIYCSPQCKSYDCR